MPTIPIQPQLLSTDVPGASTNPLQSSGQTGAALASFGSGASSELFALANKAKEAESISTSSEAHAQDMLDSQTKYNDLKSSSPDGYAVDDDGNAKLNPDGTQRTITEEYRDWANDRFQSTQLQMPTLQAQQMYQQKALPFYTEQIMHMSNDEDVLSTKASEQSDSNILQGFSSDLVSAASTDKAYQYSNTISSSIMEKSGNVYSAPDALKKIQLSNQQVAESTMKGAYNQVLSDARSGSATFDRTGQIQYWRSVMSGDDAGSQARKKMGLPTISDMLDPDKKAALDKEFIELNKTAHELDMSNLRNTVRDSVAALQMGAGNRVDAAGLFSQIDQMQARGKIQPGEAADVKANLTAAQAIGVINTPGFSLASPAFQQQQIDTQAKRVYGIAQVSGGSRVSGSAAESAFRDQAMSVVQQSQSAKQKDFSAFVESNDPSVATSMANLDYSAPQGLADKSQQIQSAIQKTQVYYDQNFPGQPQFARIISKDRSELLAKTLKDPNVGSEQTADSVTALTKAYGPYYPELVNQMVKDGDLPRSWQIASFLPPGLATQEVVSSLKGNGAVEKNFKTVAEAKGQSDKQFDKSVADESAGWISAFSSQNPGDAMTAENAQAMQSVVKNKAMQLYVASGGNMNATEASQKAVSSLLGQNAYLEQTSGARSSLVMIPKTTGTRPINDLERDQVLSYMNTKNTGDDLKSFGVVPPPIGGAKLPADVQKQASDAFYEKAAQTGRWSLAKDYQGYNYFYTDPKSGQDVPARVPNPKGGMMPLYVPLSTMMAPNSAPQRAKMDTFMPYMGSK